MLDFVLIATRMPKAGVVEIYPKFIVKKSSDLMIRGGDFYAVWVEERGTWSTNEQDVITMIDRDLKEFYEEYKQKNETTSIVKCLYLWDAETHMIDRWHSYCQSQLRDSYHNLDETLIFSNTPVTKEDYSSKRLPYPLEHRETPAYERLVSTLYEPNERHKLEWAIGSIVDGASKDIQKFVVLYGQAGSGKSTMLNIIQQLFEGYYAVFDAKALGSSNSSFALEPFKANPLVAIQHDGDLSRIEDNTRLNSLASHETMVVNEKFKAQYENRFKAFMFLGTNRPVKITDGKSGLLRRLIDISPSGNKVPTKEYHTLMGQIEFELGGIAEHCRRVFVDDPGAYDDYIPLTMLGASNDFYNFVLDQYFYFEKEDAIDTSQAWMMYIDYCEKARIGNTMTMRAFREEMRNYFREFDGHVYRGFRKEKFALGGANEKKKKMGESDILSWLKFDKTESLLDEIFQDCPAQYANSEGTPLKNWDSVHSTLKDITSTNLHYVLPIQNHIVIDFDITNADGEKSYEKNLEAASKWPPTYAELSKSGQGIHLHYIYDGDVSKLSPIFDKHIEVKIFSGKSSLRRKLTKCNDLPIATISSGIPLREEKPLISNNVIKTERGLRHMIKRNLNREIHANTTPSVQFIQKILDDAYNSGMQYDVSDLRTAVVNFAMGSTHQAEHCLEMVEQMKFQSDDITENIPDAETDDAPIIFFDTEVFPNLFVVCWKLQGAENPVIKMINPTPSDIRALMKYRIIGFNNRGYDNHILYGRMLGYENPQLYELSQRLIGKETKGTFGQAYNLSYTDIYDFSVNKQSLKKWEIELGIHHQEFGLPWDEPVSPERFIEVAEYCANDVIATEAVFDHLQGDWTARQILADLAGMTVNDSTNTLTTHLIFGNEKNPALVYTDLATGQQYGNMPGYESKYPNAFPGYEYVDGHNFYKGEDVGRGGYVWVKEGMYGRTVTLDVSAMHPHSIIAMNYFGIYTPRYEEMVNTRALIKHGDFETTSKMFDGKLAPYLTDKKNAKSLSNALKLAQNSCYGMTSARYDNAMKHSMNKNNIVALRGALFMCELKNRVIEFGGQPIHCKTDSIKLVNPTQELIDFCMDFAKSYGYEFEIEHVFEKICIVNKSTYIAKLASDDPDDPGKWTATADQFSVPYVFKTLFSHEDILFQDVCETKTVQTAIYIDMNEALPDVTAYEKELDKLKKKWPDENGEYPLDYEDTVNDLNEKIAKGHDYIFVGKVGLFCPMVDGAGGGLLMRKTDTGYSAVTGTKNYRWMESEMVESLDKKDQINYDYYNELVADAIETISKFGDFEWFVNDDASDIPPWDSPDSPWSSEEEKMFAVR